MGSEGLGGKGWLGGDLPAINFKFTRLAAADWSASVIYRLERNMSVLALGEGEAEGAGSREEGRGKLEELREGKRW